jgi:hypothetical protein
LSLYEHAKKKNILNDLKNIAMKKTLILINDRLYLHRESLLNLSLLILFVFIIGSCKKDSNDVPNTKYTVYTAGFIWNNGNFPCYWKGTSRTDLPGGTGAFTTSIFVSDGIVYTAGYYINSKGRQAPCYWKGIEKINLPCDSTYDAYTTSIYVSNGTVYNSGHYTTSNAGNGVKSLACYWVNSIRKELNDNSVSWASISSIFVVDTTVYLGGCRSGQQGHSVPCYWKSKIRTDLSMGNTTNGEVNSIYVSNGNIYTCGFYGDMRNPCYWIGTVENDLATSINGYATCIYVDEGSVYTSGLLTQQGKGSCYWVDNSRIDLNGSEAVSIYAKEGTVFTAGRYYKSSGNPDEALHVPCYWIGSSRVDLPVIVEHDHNSTTSIFVE